MKTNVNSQLVEIIIELHVIFGEYDKIVVWLKADNPHFGYISPINLINRGKGKKVLEFIAQATHEREITNV